MQAYLYTTNYIMFRKKHWTTKTRSRDRIGGHFMVPDDGQLNSPICIMKIRKEAIEL